MMTKRISLHVLAAIMLFAFSCNLQAQNVLTEEEKARWFCAAL